MIDNELINIVGKENAFDNPEILKEYAEDSSFAPPKTPACVLKPANLEELKGVVKWANVTRTPLVPISSGVPHFRGDTVPVVDGTVIVDLRRMNKIIRVNYANRVALVEPGVTFAELQAALAKEGLCAYMPLLPRRTKSVLASALEREPISMPYVQFDSTDPMLCVEIVFGTGDRMRTGEAADKMEAVGAFFSLPYRPWADVAYRRSSDTADMQRKVKGIFDPNGILNPGQLCFR